MWVLQKGRDTFKLDACTQDGPLVSKESIWNSDVISDVFLRFLLSKNNTTFGVTRHKTTRVFYSVFVLFFYYLFTFKIAGLENNTLAQTRLEITKSLEKPDMAAQWLTGSLAVSIGRPISDVHQTDQL